MKDKQVGSPDIWATWQVTEENPIKPSQVLVGILIRIPRSQPSTTVNSRVLNVSAHRDHGLSDSQGLSHIQMLSLKYSFAF